MKRIAAACLVLFVLSLAPVQAEARQPLRKILRGAAKVVRCLHICHRCG